ncbi:hypothetical protein MOQ_001893 [Trypanosoma cruzi marinkellei]|uniref:Calponin-homology (CH) domain-containing protein n=1 Tax=Trypanosoma cruzi marinkellei TaxID=85056 RepID=K2MRE9_TRYCR|nr:hypothetical protein MOQ_001893 [Trypanosoma cruzi marinkellei]
MADAAKKAAVLLLVRQLLAREGVDTGGETKPLPEKYEDLRDGAFLYRILARISPETFPDADEMTEQAPSSRQNWVVRKGNLVALVRHMNDYAHQFLGAPETLNLTLLISPTEIANLPELDEESEAPLEREKGMECLMELTDIFVVMVVLSGDPAILQAVKSLPHAEQVVLSNAAKACITKHALRPRRHHEKLTLEDSLKSGLHRGVTAGCTESSSLVGEAALNQQILQLRRGLDDANAKVVELDSKLHLALTERQEWESKYKNLLAEAELRRMTAAGEEHLRQLLAKKEEIVQKLTATIEDQKKRISAFKEATAAQETALGSFRRKLKHTEEELMKKNVERREALDRLSVTERSLAAQMNTQAELERQLEDLRTELALANAQPHNGMEHGEACLNRSFGSVNSVDRVVQLENELDEARSQKEAAERLLQVFQRQVASLPSEGFGSSAAMGALKAQLRQAEKEKEELRNQLAATIAKLEDAQGYWRRRGSTSFVENETESLVVGGKTGGGNVDSPPGREEKDGTCRQHRPCEKQDGVSREKTLLGSTLLLLGYRNLMLQQQLTLTGGGKFAASGDGEKENNGAFAGNTGSFLTRHRHEVEQGLLRSVLSRGG